MKNEEHGVGIRWPPQNAYFIRHFFQAERLGLRALDLIVDQVMGSRSTSHSRDDHDLRWLILNADFHDRLDDGTRLHRVNCAFQARPALSVLIFIDLLTRGVNVQQVSLAINLDLLPILENSMHRGVLLEERRPLSFDA